MNQLMFNVDYEKCTQALNFFAKKEGGRINKMKALKLIFFADRFHLRKYGRLLTNDNYVAMSYGPVPSNTKDIAELNEFLDDVIKKYIKNFLNFSNNYEIHSKNDVDEEVFSESDTEALNYSWEKFGSYNQFELANITHDYPEWRKLKDKVVSGSCYPMDLLDFLNDPEGSNDKCYDLTEEEKREVKDKLKESAHIELLWR